MESAKTTTAGFPLDTDWKRLPFDKSIPYFRAHKNELPVCLQLGIAKYMEVTAPSMSPFISTPGGIHTDNREIEEMKLTLILMAAVAECKKSAPEAAKTEATLS